MTAALLHGSNDILITQNRWISHFNANTFADCIASSQITRIIMCRGNVNSDANIWFNKGSSCLRAAAANLLLNGKYIINVVRISSVIFTKCFN